MIRLRSLLDGFLSAARASRIMSSKTPIVTAPKGMSLFGSSASVSDSEDELSEELSDELLSDELGAGSGVLFLSVFFLVEP